MERLFRHAAEVRIQRQEIVHGDEPSPSQVGLRPKGEGSEGELPSEPLRAGRATRLIRALATRPSIVYAALTALAFPILEMLVFGQDGVQYVHDVFDDSLPRLVSIPADFRQFGPSLWDPHLTGGNSLFSQFSTSFVSPEVLLSFIVSPFVAYAVTYFGLVFVAGYGMHLFLRDSMRLPLVACYFGGILAIFNFWHFFFNFAIALIPLHLWLTDRLLSDGRKWRRYWIGLVLVGAFDLNAGGLQFAVLVGLLQMGYLVVMAWSSGRLVRSLAGGVGAWVFASLLAAPLLLTQLVYLGGSHRTAWNLSYLIDVTPLHAFADRIGFYAAVIVGVPLGPVTGTGETYGTYFLGAIALPFLLLGLFSLGKGRRERLLLVLLVGVPIADYLFTVATPLQMQIGLIQSFQFTRVRNFEPFFLAVIASVGVASMARGGIRAALAGRMRTGLFVGAVGLLALEAVYVAIRVVLAINLVDAPQLTVEGWALGLLAMGFVALWVGVLVTLWRGWGRAMYPRFGAVLLVILLVCLVGERATYARAERYLNGGLGTFASAMTEDPAQTFIAEQANPAMQRTLTAGADANRMLIAGLQEAGGYQVAYPLVYHDLFGVLIEAYLKMNQTDSIYYHDWGNRAYAFGPLVTMPIADLMGIRWIYSNRLVFSDPRLVARFTWQDVRVYENSLAFPRAFVVGREQLYPTKDALFEGLSTASVDDLRTTAYLLSSAEDPQLGSAAVPDLVATTDATFVSYTPDRVEVSVKSAKRGMLVLTDTYAPGWTASVDGNVVPIVAVDGAFRGVQVPSGESRVVFSYRPVFTYVGFGLAAGGSLMLVGIALLPIRRRARARSSAAASVDG